MREGSNDDDCCWICDGWNEVEFKWRISKKCIIIIIFKKKVNFFLTKSIQLGTSGELKATDPLFLHLSFEDFNPIYYGK